MSLPVVLTEQAETDLDEAAQWYEQQTGLGADLVAEARTVFDGIGQLPEIHALVYRDVRRSRLRRFPYTEFYRVRDDRVEVIAVYHQRRDPAGWQSRV